jgi:hypothetical protein
MVSVLRSSGVAMCDSFLVRVRRRSGLKIATVLCGNGSQRLRRAMLQKTSIEIFTNVDDLLSFTFELLRSLLGERSENLVRSYAERSSEEIAQANVACELLRTP